MNIYKKRLLNVAVALRGEAERRKKLGLRRRKEDEFEMANYVNVCGTPGCAFGAYASRTDLQSEFKIKGRDIILTVDEDDEFLSYDSKAVMNHFNVDLQSAEDLFSAAGCDGADTEEEAAVFIERFAERNYPGDSE